MGTLTGAGTISANGGMGNGSGLYGGGGGGGGRIAIQYNMDLFFGLTTSRGGSGCAWGGAGTIYRKANSTALGQVLADNGGQAGTNTSWASTSIIDLTVRGGAVVSPPSSQTIGTLLVAPNGWLSVANQILPVTGNATIQAGGGVLADGKGYGRTRHGSGQVLLGKFRGDRRRGRLWRLRAAGSVSSGYSAYGGMTYGSLTAPVDLGSGGGGYYGTSGSSALGGAGGGAVRLYVTGVLQVDGRISAAGGAGSGPSAGGGSGGTVSLTAGTLAGSGVFPPTAAWAIPWAAVAVVDALPSYMESMTSSGWFPLTAVAAMPWAARGPSTPRPIAKPGATCRG